MAEQRQHRRRAELVPAAIRLLTLTLALTLALTLTLTLTPTLTLTLTLTPTLTLTLNPAIRLDGAPRSLCERGGMRVGRECESHA